MIERPLISPLFHVEVVDGEGVFLLSERGRCRLSGRLIRLVAPLIDGSRTADEIVNALASQAPAAEVYYTLMLLEKEGYLVEAAGPGASEPAALWQALGQDFSVGERRLSETRVSLVTFGGVPGADFTSALSALGVQVREEGDLLVVLTDDYLQPGLDAVNMAALERARPWLLCKPAGMVLWLGPLFMPARTGCWECLASRLRTNRQIESYPQRLTGRSAPILAPQLALPSSLQTGFSLAATETARWLACGRSALEGVLITLDLATLTSDRHTLVRRPQCPRCGDAEYRSARKAEPIVLQSRPKGAAAGGARSIRPEATLARYGHHVSRLTGVVAELRRVSQDGDIIAAYVARSNASRALDGNPLLRQDQPSLSGGKGLTDMQARVGALCEALERHSGRFQGYEPRVRATYRELGQDAIHPNACMLFSDQQYEQRQDWNARGSRFHFVPEPFDPACELDWTPVWSLTRSAWRYLPAQYCYRDCPSERGPRFCRADSNGSAAGNSREEAILHGFFELVERDCVAIWWYNRLKRPVVDLDSFADPHIAELQRYYCSLGREIWVLDIMNDLEIPTFVAASRRTDGSGEELVMGFGAHVDARIALLRALAEMSQLLVPVRRWATLKEQELTFLEPDLRRWLQTATLAAQPYLAADPAVPPRLASSYALSVGDDLLNDIERCRRTVERHGMELLVLDQTRPDIGLPVVKVIVPGLRHFWPRFGPGRLYDVPVKLGWLEEPLREEHLNPLPLFL